MRDGTYLFTSESMTEGHPDKVCDQISDAVLDEILKQDNLARVACEAITGRGFILVTGEITTTAYVDVQKITRNVLKNVGYSNPEYGFDYRSVGIITSINEQSPDIAQGVNENEAGVGAGDQGMMSGYASNETSVLMPASILFAHKLSKKLADVRKSSELSYLRPDGKTQVTIEFEGNKIKSFKGIVIAAQHDEDVKLEKLREDIKERVIEPVCSEYLTKKTQYFINNTGRFVIGGPVADAGCTGRKIIADTYGGVGNHGGGAFSGKDPTKVDRTAAYMCRHVAKNIVAAELADRCEVQVSYAIGSREPISLFIDAFGTNKVSANKIYEAVNKTFSFNPSEMIEYLDLRRPIFSKTTCYGHFGRKEKEFTWEETDRAEELRNHAK